MRTTMKRLLSIAAVVAVSAAFGLPSKAQDLNSLGPWLEHNMDMGDTFRSSGATRYGNWTFLDYDFNRLRQHWYKDREFVDATFRGGVYGVNQDGARQSGSITMRFQDRVGQNPTFSAAFSGIPALADIENGAMYSQDVYVGNTWNWPEQRYENVYKKKWTMNGEVYNPADFSAIDWSQGTGMATSTSTSLQGAFYKRGGTVAGSVFGVKQKYGFEKDGQYISDLQSFDGVFSARK